MNDDSPRNMRNRKREMYVYAGKVHVRGLLRRVWRPRYLALGDDGYLRYHESIPPLFQQDLHNQPHNPYSSLSMAQSSHNSYSNMYSIHHTHRPKSTLAILDGARTIDANSLVDQHVALPQGVYGFVFRGRPVEMYTNSDVNSDSEQGALIVPPERSSALAGHDNRKGESSKLAKKAAVVNLVFPKGTNRRKTVQKIAKKAINPDVLCCGGGLSPSSSPIVVEKSGYDEYDNEGHSTNEWGRDSHESHDTIGSFQPVDCTQICGDLTDSVPPDHHHSQQKIKMLSVPKTKVQVQVSSIQSREYLCAVSTAEEAESWVVALRWAAEHRRGVRYLNSVRRNEDTINNAFVSAFPNTTDDLIRNMVSDEPISPGKVQVPSKISDKINGMESHGSKSTNKRSSDCSEGKGDRESNTQKEISDNKTSLNSLLVEPDGWRKTEKGKRERANEISEETWVKAPPEPSLFPNNESDNDTDAETEGLSRDDPKPPALLESPLLPSSRKQQQQQSNSVGATIIVTKVSKFHLPQSEMAGLDHKGHGTHRDISWFPFHFPLPGDDLVLQYEIQLLLLKNKTRNEISVQPEFVEERIVRKSMHDMLTLVQDLIAELNASDHDDLSQEVEENDQSNPPRKAGPTLLQPDETFRLLEDVESKLLYCLDKSIKNGTGALAVGKPNSSVIPNGSITELVTEAFASVSTVDIVMRKLSKDKNICSSRHFQDFLGFHSTNRRQGGEGWGELRGHAVSSESDQSSAVSPTSAVSEVKKFLAEIHHPSTMTKLQLVLAISLRHTLGGPMVSLMVIWSANRLASVAWFMISGAKIIIPVPLETYATLLALTFFIGHKKGVSSRSRHDKHKLVKQSRKVRSMPSSASVDQSHLRHPKTTVDNKFSAETMPVVDDDHSTVAEEEVSESESDDGTFMVESSTLSSPLPLYPANGGITCWSKPNHKIFMVRSASYLRDRIKSPSAPAAFECRGVDVWITENAERNIARHPSVLGGNLDKEDTFIVNFLLPFANFVAYFTIPPIEEMPANIANVWSLFIKGDQQYRDGKLKLLPVVVDGPWIVRKAVGPGTSPAMVGRDLPLQYYFTDPTATKRGVYEVDVLVTASRIARGILNVVKGHTKSLTIAFAFIIEASEEVQLPETVLCAFQVHSLHLEDCPNLPDCYPDG